MKKLKSIFWHIFYILLGVCYVIVPDNPGYKILGACLWLLLLYLHFVIPNKQEHHNKMMKIYQEHAEIFENIQNQLLDLNDSIDKLYLWNIELQKLLTEMLQNNASKNEIDIAQSQISQNDMQIKYLQNIITDLEKCTKPVLPEWKFF